jgi:signal transduction histidine kinase
VLLGVVAFGPRLDRTPYSTEDLEFCDRIGARVAMVAAREALALEVATLRTAAAGSERLASVGRMAAGLAHEIRNPLVSIRTFTQLLPERHADEEFRNGFIDNTLGEIDRICTLVCEILSYARHVDSSTDGSDAPTTDVAETLGRTCQLLRSHARSAGVSLDFESEDLCERAAIDEDKLRQVVINLVVNGIQASGGRGRVRVSASSRQGATCALDRIVVDVHDDGLGMTADVASRIFEPFFTTRREGTGLGLALVKTILDEAGASIGVETAPGHGTTFRIELLPERLAELRPPVTAQTTHAPESPRLFETAETRRSPETTQLELLVPLLAEPVA